MRWAYTPFTLAGSRTHREVQYRYLSKDGSSETTYGFYRDPADSGRTTHAWMDMLDPSGISEKAWFFDIGSNAWSRGLLIARDDRLRQGPVSMVAENYTWAQDAASNPYISPVLTTNDPGTGYQAQKKTTQTVDAWGKLPNVIPLPWQL